MVNACRQRVELVAVRRAFINLRWSIAPRLAYLGDYMLMARRCTGVHQRYVST